MDEPNLTVRKLMKHTVVSHLRKTAGLIEEITRSNTEFSEQNERRVHELRTETRRLDISLELFEGWLPENRTEWLHKQLKKIRKKAGAVRNFDVLMPLLEHATKPIPKKARNWLLKRALSSRTDASDSLKRTCRKVIGHRFKQRGKTLKRHFGWRMSSAAPSVKEFSFREIQRHAETFFSRVERVKADPAILHPTRIAGRKLRYTLELLEDALAESLVHTACDRLSEVQDTLGKANDQEFALHFLNVSESQCNRKSIASVLPSAIDWLDVSAEKQVKHAIHDVAEIADRIQTLLNELIQKT